MGRLVHLSYIFLVCSHLSSVRSQDLCSNIDAEISDHVLQLNNTCFHLVQQSSSWQKARDACKARDMVLVAIPDVETNTQLYQRGVDLDFNDVGTSTSYWIGGRFENGQTIWEKNPETGYKNFEDDRQNRNGCITLELSLEGRWAVNNCEVPPVYAGYICAKHHVGKDGSSDKISNGSGSSEPSLYVCCVQFLLMYWLCLIWDQR